MNPKIRALLETRKLVPPGPVPLEKLAKYRFRRHAVLFDLPFGHGICAWCNVEPIPKGRSRKKYCSKDCQFSSEVYAAPQKETAKAFFLIDRQGCACPACGLDYTDQLEELIVNRWRHVWHNKGTDWAVTPEPHVMKYWSVGRDTGHIWHVDHVIPLHKGGDGIGWSNHQVLCVACHERKTAEERRVKP